MPVLKVLRDQPGLKEKQELTVQMAKPGLRVPQDLKAMLVPRELPGLQVLKATRGIKV
jgi:hypothetical protein